MIRSVEIVRNIKVRPAITIPVPPRGGKAIEVAGHSSFGGDIGEGLARSFVAEKVIVLTGVDLLVALLAWQLDEVCILTEGFRQHRFSIGAATERKGL